MERSMEQQSSELAGLPHREFLETAAAVLGEAGLASCASTQSAEAALMAQAWISVVNSEGRA